MCWLDRQPPSQWLAIAGGGKLVDALRALQSVHGLSDDVLHWRCIEAMAIHAALVAAILPVAQGPIALDEILASSPSTGVWLIDPVTLVRDVDARRSSQPLPTNWDVSSDSIAARLAALAGAEECVLLKSTLPPPGTTLVEASRQGYVDAYLPRADFARRPMRCVDLRNERLPETNLG